MNKEQLYSQRLREIIREKKVTPEFDSEAVMEDFTAPRDSNKNNFGNKLINHASPMQFDGASRKKKSAAKRKTRKLKRYIRLAKSTAQTAKDIRSPDIGAPQKKMKETSYQHDRSSMNQMYNDLSPEEQEEAPSVPPEDPTESVQEPSDKEKLPERPSSREPDRISPSSQKEKGLNFKNVLNKAKERKSVSDKIKGAQEKFQKAAKVAKQLQKAKNIKQAWNIFKVGTGITIEGLILTYLAMLTQYILGDIFHVRNVPPLGRFERIIFFIATIVFVPLQIACLIMMFGPALVGLSAVFKVFELGADVLKSIGIN